MSQSAPDDPLKLSLSKAVSEAMRLLLSTRHLYQSVTVDVKFLDAAAATRHAEAAANGSRPRGIGTGTRPYVPPVASFRAGLQGYTQAAWFPINVAPLVQTGTDILFHNSPQVQKFPLPTIRTTCCHCGENEPFNPVGALVETSNASCVNQWISMSYMCQNCKQEPIRFLVRRTGLKLTLCGRDPFETVELPSFIPKKHADNIRNALIANHAGQTLAGIFLMRVFVEQFWKSVPEVANVVKDKPRPTGDELGRV